MSRLWLMWLKIRTREPFAFIEARSLSRMTILLEFRLGARPSYKVGLVSEVHHELRPQWSESKETHPSKRHGWSLPRAVHIHCQQRKAYYQAETHLHDHIHQTCLALLLSGQTCNQDELSSMRISSRIYASIFSNGPIPFPLSWSSRRKYWYPFLFNNTIYQRGKHGPG